MRTRAEAPRGIVAPVPPLAGFLRHTRRRGGAPGPLRCGTRVAALSLMRVTSILVLLVTLGCSDGEIQLVVNEGIVCLHADDPADPLVSGDLTVEVTFPCASACIRDVESSCTASLDGDAVRVDSRFEYEEHIDGNACPASCNPLVTRCELGALPVGTYDFWHGGHRFDLEVEADTGTTCVGSE